VYFTILKKKTMDKAAIDEAKEAKRKQKEDDRLRKVANTPTLAEQATL
jgi:hypothetical protein